MRSQTLYSRDKHFLVDDHRDFFQAISFSPGGGVSENLFASRKIIRDVHPPGEKESPKNSRGHN